MLWSCSLKYTPTLRGWKTFRMSRPRKRKARKARTASSAPVKRGFFSRSVSSSPLDCTPGERKRRPRSEEHTSELQSRLHLVCRLLLEKKKKNKREINT